ncbi:hypothetical protein FHW88_005029 [Mucilaginibacter sp. SG538B]|nr:hypothetical protein [Mucilaginibacter sp. SG538B]
MIAVVKINADRTTNETLIIPGHGLIGKIQRLIDFDAMIITACQKFNC